MPIYEIRARRPVRVKLDHPNLSIGEQFNLAIRRPGSAKFGSGPQNGIERRTLIPAGSTMFPVGPSFSNLSWRVTVSADGKQGDLYTGPSASSLGMVRHYGGVLPRDFNVYGEPRPIAPGEYIALGNVGWRRFMRTRYFVANISEAEEPFTPEPEDQREPLSPQGAGV